MSNDTLCSICSGNTIGVSPIMKITPSTTLDWENDSAMELLGWKQAEVQLRFCCECFHSIIFPKFDTGKLYGTSGPEVRKKVYESYFPGSRYGGKDHKLTFSKHFTSMSQDFLRFHRTSAFIARAVKTIFADIEEVKILDWGGGDGYISATYCGILSVVTGLPVRSFVYDYIDWPESKSNKVGIEDLKKMDKFHIVIFSHLLEHTHDPITTIKSALPFLETQGLVICEVPDQRVGVLEAAVRKKVGLNYHVAYFSKRSLYRVLEYCGLNNIHTTYQSDSSYRGNKTGAILGIAQKEEDSLLKAKSPSSFTEEIICLIMVAVREVFRRVSRRIVRVVREMISAEEYAGAEP